MYRCTLSLFVEGPEGNTTVESAGEIVLACLPEIGVKIDLTNRNLADENGVREPKFVTVEQVYHLPVSDTEAYEPHSGNSLHLICR